MDQNDCGLDKIEPKILPRECGGWLAITPRWSPIRIGVTGATEAAARDRFRAALAKWAEALAAP
jgi:hypothetical protein